MVHDQATILELKSMFAEMKELLQQQVICCLTFKDEMKISHFNVSTSSSELR